jgi:hypothetical protein
MACCEMDCHGEKEVNGVGKQFAVAAGMLVHLEKKK